MSTNYFDTKLFTGNIPKEILEKISHLKLKGRPYAAFDLDNTLLIDDIGEAVFAALVKKKLVLDFNWRDYINLIEQNREAAYKKIIEVMNGLELETLKKITHEIINSEDTHIEIGDDKIPIPEPNSIVQSLISLLKTKGIDVYIVTASNKVSADIICWKHFGTPSSNVLGAIVGTDRNERISYDSSEIPYGEGKVNALKKRFKDKPVVTGGDGMWDKFLLDYTTSDGIRLWLGQNKNEYQKLKDEYYKDLNFYHIPKQ
jgi:phosphoserine phosphatase